jgi:hypothetical protein
MSGLRPIVRDSNGVWVPGSSMSRPANGAPAGVGMAAAPDLEVLQAKHAGA